MKNGSDIYLRTAQNLSDSISHSIEETLALVNKGDELSHDLSAFQETLLQL